MEQLELVRLHLRYHSWATMRMWEIIDQLNESELDYPRVSSFGTIRLTLEHMYKADRLWLLRIRGSGHVQFSAIEAPHEISRLKSVWLSQLEELDSAVHELSKDALEATRSFVNSKGDSFRTPVWQILLHVVNHGTGHRGQVNGLLRECGKTPLSTDLIQFYRLFEVNTLIGETHEMTGRSEAK